MKQEINPQDTSRSRAFELWIKSPMPMVTLTKTFDITRLYKASRRKGLKINMLLCHCIGLAASRIDEFYLLPEQDKLFKYDRLSINIIVKNRKGDICSCDVAYSDDPAEFNTRYTSLTTSAYESCESFYDEESMVIGTSAMVETELDSIVNQYSTLFNNPMVMWGKYRKGLFKVKLPISFQFHHSQMDGGHATSFLSRLQEVINSL
jgi:chloramphenicol O-acetyltransferase type A